MTHKATIKNISIVSWKIITHVVCITIITITIGNQSKVNYITLKFINQVIFSKMLFLQVWNKSTIQINDRRSRYLIRKWALNKSFPLRLQLFAFKIIMRRIGINCDIIMTLLILPLILIHICVALSKTGFDFPELGK